MSEVVCTKPQEEYEDDFEKDLDWLICEESRSEDQVSNNFLLSFLFVITLLHSLSREAQCALLTADLVQHGSLNLLCKCVTVSRV